MSDEADIAALVNAYQTAKRTAEATRVENNKLLGRLTQENNAVDKAQEALLEALGIEPENY